MWVWYQKYYFKQKIDFVHTAFPELLNDVEKGARTEEWMDVWAASWSHCDVRGLYENAMALVNLLQNFEKDFLNLVIPRCFVYGEQNFPKDETATTADIPNTERLESFGVKVENSPHSGHELKIENPQDFSESMHLFLQSQYK